eukprot:gene3999-5001_t
MSSIRVVCRFRPQNKNELSQGGYSIIEVTDNQTVNIKGAETNHTFTFDRIFHDRCTQKDVYDDAAKPVIEDIMSGYNGCLLVYGQTSSGKTHTMQGPSIDDVELKGVIPRMINTVFDWISKADENIEFIVKASYIEIYMEKIRDLLDTRKDNLRVREEKGKGVWVEGTTEVYIYREDDILEVMRTGASNRAIAETKMNAESSRSHSIFILSIQQKNLLQGSVKTGKLYLVDLAGSEKVGKTGAAGLTLDEAKMINKSLSSLGNVINALTDGKSTHIPYRDSKLTRVLQESLGGNSRTTLIINCSPSSYNETETISTLRFGNRAKSIKNKAKINQERSAAELKILLSKAEKEIESLKAYIKEIESVTGIIIPKDKIKELSSNSTSNTSATPNNNTSNNNSSANAGSEESAESTNADSQLLKALQEKCLSLEKLLFQKETEKKELLEQLESQLEQIQDKDQEMESQTQTIQSMQEDINKYTLMSQGLTNENSILMAQLTDLKLTYEKSKYEATEQALQIEGLNAENGSIKAQITILQEKFDSLKRKSTSLGSGGGSSSSISSSISSGGSEQSDIFSSPNIRSSEDPSISVLKHDEEWNEKAEQLKQLQQRTPSKPSKSTTSSNSSPILFNPLENDSTTTSNPTSTTNADENLQKENQQLRLKIEELEASLEVYKLAQQKQQEEQDQQAKEIPTIYVSTNENSDVTTITDEEDGSKSVSDIIPSSFEEIPSEMMLQAEQLRKLITENSEQKKYLESYKSENTKLKSRIENIEEETRQRMEEELNILREQTNQKLSEFGALKESLLRDLENRCQKVIDLELVLDEFQDRVATLTERLKRATKMNSNGEQESSLIQLKLDEVTSIKHQLVIENNKYKIESQRNAKQLALRNEHILSLENTLKESQDRLLKLALNYEAVTNELNKLSESKNKQSPSDSGLSGARIVRPLRGGGGALQHKSSTGSNNLYTNTSRSTREVQQSSNHPSPLSLSISNNTSAANSQPVSTSASPNGMARLSTENSSSSLWNLFSRKKGTPMSPSPSNTSPPHTPSSPIPPQPSFVTSNSSYAPAVPTSPISLNNRFGGSSHYGGSGQYVGGGSNSNYSISAGGGSGYYGGGSGQYGGGSSHYGGSGQYNQNMMMGLVPSKPIRPSFKTTEGYYKLIKEISPQPQRYMRKIFRSSYSKISLFYQLSPSNSIKQQQQQQQNCNDKNSLVSSSPATTLSSTPQHHQQPSSFGSNSSYHSATSSITTSSSKQQQQQLQKNPSNSNNIIIQPTNERDKLYCSYILMDIFLGYNFINIDKAEYEERPHIQLKSVPTCQKINKLKNSSKLQVAVGTECGDVYYFDPIDRNNAVHINLFNKDGNRSKCTCIEWIPNCFTQFIVGFANGVILVFDINRTDQPINNNASNGNSNSGGGGSGGSNGNNNNNLNNSTNNIYNNFNNEKGPYINQQKNTRYNPVSEWNISNKSINSIAFSPDGKYLAIACQDGNLYVYNYDTRTPIVTFKSYFGGFLCVDWSPDGKYLATGGEDDYVSIWSFEQEKCLVSRGQGHQSWVGCIKFDPYISNLDPNTYRILSGGEDTRLLLWDFSRETLRKPRGKSISFVNKDSNSTTTTLPTPIVGNNVVGEKSQQQQTSPPLATHNQYIKSNNSNSNYNVQYVYSTSTAQYTPPRPPNEFFSVLNDDFEPTTSTSSQTTDKKKSQQQQQQQQWYSTLESPFPLSPSNSFMQIKYLIWKNINLYFKSNSISKSELYSKPIITTSTTTPTLPEQLLQQQNSTNNNVHQQTIIKIIIDFLSTNDESQIIREKGFSLLEEFFSKQFSSLPVSLVEELLSVLLNLLNSNTTKTNEKVIISQSLFNLCISRNDVNTSLRVIKLILNQNFQNSIISKNNNSIIEESIPVESFNYKPLLSYKVQEDQDSLVSNINSVYSMLFDNKRDYHLSPCEEVSTLLSSSSSSSIVYRSFMFSYRDKIYFRSLDMSSGVFSVLDKFTLEESFIVVEDEINPLGSLPYTLFFDYSTERIGVLEATSHHFRIRYLKFVQQQQDPKQSTTNNTNIYNLKQESTKDIELDKSIKINLNNIKLNKDGNTDQILNQLEKYDIGSIYPSDKSGIYFLTKNNDLYFFGSNGIWNCWIENKPIFILSSVKKFIFSNPDVLILLENGTVYTVCVPTKKQPDPLRMLSPMSYIIKDIGITYDNFIMVAKDQLIKIDRTDSDYTFHPKNSTVQLEIQSLGIGSDLFYFISNEGHLYNLDLFSTHTKVVLDSNLPELKVKRMEAGYLSFFVVTEDGRIFAKGDNAFGQLGISSFKEIKEFEEIFLPFNLSDPSIRIIPCQTFTLVHSTVENALFYSGNIKGLKPVTSFTPISTGGDQIIDVGVSEFGYSILTQHKPHKYYSKLVSSIQVYNDSNLLGLLLPSINNNNQQQYYLFNKSNYSLLSKSVITNQPKDPFSISFQSTISFSQETKSINILENLERPSLTSTSIKYHNLFFDPYSDSKLNSLYYSLFLFNNFNIQLLNHQQSTEKSMIRIPSLNSKYIENLPRVPFLLFGAKTNTIQSSSTTSYLKSNKPIIIYDITIHKALEDPMSLLVTGSDGSQYSILKKLVPSDVIVFDPPLEVKPDVQYMFYIRSSAIRTGIHGSFYSEYNVSGAKIDLRPPDQLKNESNFAIRGFTFSILNHSPLYIPSVLGSTPSNQYNSKDLFDLLQHFMEQFTTLLSSYNGNTNQSEPIYLLYRNIVSILSILKQNPKDHYHKFGSHFIQFVHQFYQSKVIFLVKQNRSTFALLIKEFSEMFTNYFEFMYPSETERVGCITILFQLLETNPSMAGMAYLLTSILNAFIRVLPTPVLQSLSDCKCEEDAFTRENVDPFLVGFYDSIESIYYNGGQTNKTPNTLYKVLFDISSSFIGGEDRLFDSVPEANFKLSASNILQKLLMTSLSRVPIKQSNPSLVQVQSLERYKRQMRKWVYEGYCDAITMKASRNIYITGIGVYCEKGKNVKSTVDYVYGDKVYPDLPITSKLVDPRGVQVSDSICALEFNYPVPLKAGQQISFLNTDYNSSYVGEGQDSQPVYESNGINFTFSVTKIIGGKHSGTNLYVGQFPIIYYQLEMDESFLPPNQNSVKVAMDHSLDILKDYNRLLNGFILSNPPPIDAIRNQTFLNIVLPSIIDCYFSNCSSNSIQLELFMKLLESVTRLNKFYSDQQKQQQLIDQPAPIQIFKLESAHPYGESTKLINKVTFPSNVKWMTIQFDSRSCTSQTSDRLLIYSDLEYKVPIKPDGFSKKSFPTSTILVPGNKLLFDFNTASAHGPNGNIKFGYACTVHGYENIPQDKNLPLSDLETQISFYISLYLSSQLIGNTQKKAKSIPDFKKENEKHKKRGRRVIGHDSDSDSSSSDSESEKGEQFSSEEEDDNSSISSKSSKSSKSSSSSSSMDRGGVRDSESSSDQDIKENGDSDLDEKCKVNLSVSQERVKFSKYLHTKSNSDKGESEETNQFSLFVFKKMWEQLKSKVTINNNPNQPSPTYPNDFLYDFLDRKKGTLGNDVAEFFSTIGILEVKSAEPKQPKKIKKEKKKDGVKDGVPKENEIDEVPKEKSVQDKLNAYQNRFPLAKYDDMEESKEAKLLIKRRLNNLYRLKKKLNKFNQARKKMLQLDAIEIEQDPEVRDAELDTFLKDNKNDSDSDDSDQSDKEKDNNDQSDKEKVNEPPKPKSKPDILSTYASLEHWSEKSRKLFLETLRLVDLLDDFTHCAQMIKSQKKSFADEKDSQLLQPFVLIWRIVQRKLNLWATSNESYDSFEGIGALFGDSDYMAEEEKPTLNLPWASLNYIFDLFSRLVPISESKSIDPEQQKQQNGGGDKAGIKYSFEEFMMNSSYINTSQFNLNLNQSKLSRPTNRTTNSSKQNLYNKLKLAKILLTLLHNQIQPINFVSYIESNLEMDSVKIDSLRCWSRLIKMLESPSAIENTIWVLATIIHSKQAPLKSLPGGWQGKVAQNPTITFKVSSTIRESFIHEFHNLLEVLSHKIKFGNYQDSIILNTTACFSLSLLPEDIDFVQNSEIFPFISSVLSGMHQNGNGSLLSSVIPKSPMRNGKLTDSGSNGSSPDLSIPGVDVLENQLSIGGDIKNVVLEEISTKCKFVLSKSPEMLPSLFDGNTNSFWEAPSRSSIKITLPEGGVTLVQQIAIYFDNEDNEYSIERIITKYGSKCEIYTPSQANQAWYTIPFTVEQQIALSQAGVITISFNGHDSNIRVRLIKVFAVGPPAPLKSFQLSKFESTLNLLKLLTFQIFGISAVQNSGGSQPSNNNEEIKSHVNSLLSSNGVFDIQKQIFSLISNEVQKEINHYCEENLGSKQSTSSKQDEEENQDSNKDKYLYELLTTLASLLDSEEGKSFISSKSWIFSLLPLIHSGTSRIQQLAIFICKGMIINLKPTLFDEFTREHKSPIIKSSSSFAQFLFMCVAKSLSAQVKVGSTLHNQEEYRLDKYPFSKGIDGTINEDNGLLLVQMIKHLMSKSSIWKEHFESFIYLHLSDLIKKEVIQPVSVYMTSPILWTSLACLLVIDENNDLISRIVNSKLQDSSAKNLCENHDDGVTEAQSFCNNCKMNLCADCDRIIHLPKRNSNHVKSQHLDESISIEVRESYVRLKLSTALLIVDFSKLKVIVQATPTNNYVSSTSNNCRYCQTPLTSSNMAASYNSCNNPDCVEKVEIACNKHHRDCGHICHGIKDETECLPCLHGCSKGKEGSKKMTQDIDDMCIICWTEGLSEAPSIQLECGHIFHYSCTKRLLETKWNGSRITLGFSNCPICKTQIQHPSLHKQIQEIDAIKNEIIRKGKFRMEYLGMMSDPQLKAKYNGDVEAYIFDQFAYYLCFKCKQPYYGGSNVCAAGVGASTNFNPEELICGGCQSDSSNICSKHGKEYLEYKCRYCCSVAIWFCFGTTHFCQICHNNHSDISARKTFPPCPVGPGCKPLAGDICPLHIEHPDTGKEFSLGCSIFYSQTCPSGYTLSGGVCIKPAQTQITTATCSTTGKMDLFWKFGTGNPCPTGWTILLAGVKTGSITSNKLPWYSCAQITQTVPEPKFIYFCSVGNCGNYQGTAVDIIFSQTNRFLVYSFCPHDNKGYAEAAATVNAVSATTKNKCNRGTTAMTNIKSLEVIQAVCPVGYQGTPPSCSDINECTSATHKCRAPATCGNTAGSYVCNCPAGYTKTSDGLGCTDNNECASATTHKCRAPATCANTAGSYSCSCPAGYTKTSDGLGCTDNNECASTTTHKCKAPATCANTAGSYVCNCPAGYTKTSDGFSCTDNNECASTTTHKCKAPATCSNTAGSYVCNCPAGYTKTSDGFSCTDNNECASTTTNQCKAPATCANTAGSYTCNCPAGYTKSSDGFSCIDNNECSSTTTNQCKAPATCVNSPGSYSCSCPAGYTKSSDGFNCIDNNECSSSTTNQCKAPATCVNSPGSYSCSCPAGYTKSSDGFNCIDNNECSSSTTNQCKAPATCVNSPGSYLCNCPAGYTKSSDGFSCTDNNECASTTTNQCKAPATCVNAPGNYSCSCPVGYTKSSDGFSCIDNNECSSSSTHQCKSPSTCVNSPGSYSCSCPAGYTKNMDGFGCTDNNECSSSTTNQCKSPATCVNSPGSYSCSCPSGYSKTSDGFGCVDNDECSDPDACGSEATCSNVIGSFACSCPQGLVYNSADKTCKDVNECTNNPNICGSVATCENLHGSYQCNCPQGKEFDSVKLTCIDINECTSDPTICGEATCQNQDSYYQCQCPNGFQFNKDTKKCDDKNECLKSVCGTALCNNTIGSYVCYCKKGYDLVNGNSCVDKDECTEQPGICGSVALCQNKPASYQCQCPTGYRFESSTLKCLEINECTEQPGVCGSEAVCQNSPGNFECKCPAGYSFDVETKTCQDFDECTNQSGVCGSEAVCQNSPGSFDCQCAEGFIYNADTKSCQDIDECTEQPGICGSEAVCQNKQASYQCQCQIGYRFDSNTLTCLEIDECSEDPFICGTAKCNNLPGSFVCNCESGYQLGSDGKSCDDINECSARPNICGTANCDNHPGDYSCSCDSGFVLGSDGKSCIDINECDTPDICGSAICKNTPGNYICTCDSGYQLRSDGQTCEDIDECTNGQNQCDAIAQCENSQGSYSCSCPSGYSLAADGKKCDDIDECLTTIDICGTAQCNNTNGSHFCSCPSGYVMSTSGTSCDDIDECLTTPGICGSANCFNTPGSYSCNCSPGYKLGDDQLTCEDIDECATNPCKGNSGCQNEEGSFHCSCPVGFELNPSDPLSCQDINECSITNANNCTGEHTSCENTEGGFKCACPVGFKSTSDQTSCQDIDECSDPTLNECSETTTTCVNQEGSYECKCLPGFSPIPSSQYKCSAKPIINKFYQKPHERYTFIMEGINLITEGSLPLVTVSQDFRCLYRSGNSTYLECRTLEDKEVSGEILLETNQVLSNPYNYIGAPFITGYSKKPSTKGEVITITGRNLPTGSSVKLLVNSVESKVISVSSSDIVVDAAKGTGEYNYIVVSNETSSNTDSMYITYESPIISSTTNVNAVSGGVLTIQGDNFGTEPSTVSVNIGPFKCSNIQIPVSHTLLTCQLEPTSDLSTYMVHLQVDGLLVSNNHYFSYSSEKETNCPSNCNGEGKCTDYGCVCNLGFSGAACNETTVGIKPKPPIDKPVIDVGKNDSDTSSFGYRLSVIRIEELDVSGLILEQYHLLNETWSQIDQKNENIWSFNATLANQSYLEATFQYFKLSSPITFARNTFIIPAESIKLSIQTKKWPFKSTINTLRIVVSTETTVLDDSSNCSINQPSTSNYNSHLFVVTKNQESGMTSRFISAAEIDDGIPVTPKIQVLQVSKQSSVVGISVPYFKDQSIIDPDYSLLLNAKGEKTGSCSNENVKPINWQLTTGLAVGGAAAVGIITGSIYVFKKKLIEKKWKQNFNRSKSVQRS